MMQLFPILIVMVVVAADGGLQAGFAAEPDTVVGSAWSTAIAWVPMVGLLGMAWLGVRRCEGRLEAGKTPRQIMAAERIVRYSRSPSKFVS